MKTKVCKYCDEKKLLTEFRAGKVKGKIYVRHKCKKCELELKKKWSEQNPDKCAAHKKKHYEKFKEKYNKLSEEWAKANPEKRKEIALAYAHKNTDKLSKYRNENAERIREYMKGRVINLQDSYVIHNIIGQSGLTVEDVKSHPELIKATKDIYKLKRLIKTIEDGKRKTA